MKKLEELNISPTPWKIRIRDGDYDVVDNNDDIVFEYQFEKDDIRFAATAPKMYRALCHSTNMIEHSIQFIKNKDIKIALRELSDYNKAVLAEAAGESEMKE